MGDINLIKEKMMKMKNVYLGSLTSLVVIASSIAHADEGVYVPTLEGGLTASVGTFIVTPTSDYQDYTAFLNDDGTATVQNVNPGYDWGINASLGYVFEETANSVELFFRNISTSDTTSGFGTTEFFETLTGDFSGDLGYELNSFDLMFSQFVNLGEVMQVRLSGGLAYVELEQNQNIIVSPAADPDAVATISSESEFKGWGPRVGIDTRYEFGEGLEGLGIVGGGSMAYYLGDLDYTYATSSDIGVQDDPGNHAVLNFRANLGLDYVYFFDNDERSTLGLEIGYLIDYYGDAAEYTNLDTAGDSVVMATSTDTTAISFAGPYVELKGVF